MYGSQLAPTPQQLAYCGGLQKPALIVSIDVEEEFDWSEPFSRSHRSVKSVRKLALLRDIFRSYGVRATYAVDYPVAVQPEGYMPVTELIGELGGELGAQLHPWVNPPFEEHVTKSNSFPGNLVASLEQEKLKVLGAAITESFGVAPMIYKAGRYGIGPNTAGVLCAEGYKVDLSIRAYADYRLESGPDFRAIGPHPFWFGTTSKVLAIPQTAGFTGLLRRQGISLYTFVSGAAGHRLRLPGLLASTGLLNRPTLTPEGVGLDEAIRLTRVLCETCDVKVFSLALHSPSLEAGNTPYVRTQDDLRFFLNWLDRYLDFFLGSMGGILVTPLDILDSLCNVVQDANR